MPQQFSFPALLTIAAFVFCVGIGCDSPDWSLPAVVEGDSMAPTICGEHLKVACVDCRYEFESEVAEAGGGKLTCPNCGYSEIDSCEAKVTAAAEVKLKPFARFPRRWEIVGFELEEGDQKTGIKRLVGLPGETIEIKEGDLCVRGEVLRKSWKLQKQVRIPVFDSQFNAIPPFDNAGRFQAAAAESRWRVNERGFALSQAAEEVDWLDYTHWRNCKRDGPRDAPFPICDNYGFNQATPRTLQSTDDLMIEFDAELELGSSLHFAFRRDQGECLFKITRTKDVFTIAWQGQSMRKPLVFQSRVPEARSFQMRGKETKPDCFVEFSSFDRTIMLRVNRVAVFEIREVDAENVAGQQSHFPAGMISPFRVGGSGGPLEIKRTRIWRDIHYLAGPAHLEAAGVVELSAGAEEYILLGDNSPKSLDSRTWKKPGVSRSKLIGRVESLAN